jgi:hypothetical protein
MHDSVPELSFPSTFQRTETTQLGSVTSDLYSTAGIDEVALGLSCFAQSLQPNATVVQRTGTTTTVSSRRHSPEDLNPQQTLCDNHLGRAPRMAENS